MADLPLAILLVGVGVVALWLLAIWLEAKDRNR